MKRRILGYVAVMVTVICLCAAPSFAADNAKIGFGFQGLIAGNMLNGASVRAWLGPNTAIGLEGNFFYGKGEIEYDSGSDADADLWMLEAKGMYAFLVRPNSRFYGGLKLGFGQFDADGEDGSVISPGIFAGAEYNFPQLPEVGFNFEVGYNYLRVSPDEVDVDVHGINVGLGIKYYF